MISRHNTCNSDTIVYEKLLELPQLLSSASRREKAKAQKKEYKVYTKLAEQEEQCKEKMASCETRDVRARQVTPPLSLPLFLSPSFSTYLLTLCIILYTVYMCMHVYSVLL